MKRKLSITKQYPYYVNIPLAAVSPGSIYKRFEIIEQEWALVEYGDNPRKVRSKGPFKLKFQYPWRGEMKVKTVNASKVKY